MDLFNRKALALARGRLSAMELEVRASIALIDRRNRELEYEKEAFSRVQLEREFALAESKTLLEEKHDLEVKNAVLMERLDLLTSGVLDAAPAPQTWGEDVEDAEYAFRTGRIDRGEFEAALEAAGFANTEVDFDSGSLPRI